MHWMKRTGLQEVMHLFARFRFRKYKQSSHCPVVTYSYNQQYRQMSLGYCRNAVIQQLFHVLGSTKIY